MQYCITASVAVGNTKNEQIRTRKEERMHLCISSMEEGIYGALISIKLLIKLLGTSMQYMQRRQVLILVRVPGQRQQLVS
jgi:hypothetical protein